MKAATLHLNAAANLESANAHFKVEALGPPSQLYLVSRRELYSKHKSARHRRHFPHELTAESDCLPSSAR